MVAEWWQGVLVEAASDQRGARVFAALLPGGAAPMSFRTGLGLLERTAGDGGELAEAVADAVAAVAGAKGAVFLEFPGLAAGQDPPFQFALLPAPGLLRMREDAGSFAEHLADCGGRSVTSFRNLAGDSTLVAPCPAAGVQHGHLAAFLRSAPRDRRAALFREVGAQAAAYAGGRTLYLSTSGSGVAWLHVRLDPRPKYYQYDPFRGR